MWRTPTTSSTTSSSNTLLASGTYRRTLTLHALRKGFDESGHHFDLCYFQPTSGLNPDLQKLYQGNVLQVMRQWKFSKYTEESIDNGIFLNGLPIFTAELKNPLSGQNAAHAIAQPPPGPVI